MEAQAKELDIVEPEPGDGEFTEEGADRPQLCVSRDTPVTAPYRARAGPGVMEGRPWASIEELQEIDGIGPKRLVDIREQAVVEESDEEGAPNFQFRVASRGTALAGRAGP